MGAADSIWVNMFFFGNNVYAGLKLLGARQGRKEKKLSRRKYKVHSPEKFQVAFCYDTYCFRFPWLPHGA